MRILLWLRRLDAWLMRDPEREAFEHGKELLRRSLASPEKSPEAGPGEERKS